MKRLRDGEGMRVREIKRMCECKIYVSELKTNR